MLTPPIMSSVWLVSAHHTRSDEVRIMSQIPDGVKGGTSVQRIIQHKLYRLQWQCSV